MVLFGSPGKLYLVLFFFVLIAYGAYYTTVLVKKHNEHFADLLEEEELVKDSELKEKNGLELPEKDKNIKEVSTCKNYNMRQEVLNIFDLYLGRKPSVEEIEKYSKVGNEQDILISVIKEFNIASSESESKKGKLDSMRIDSCQMKKEDSTDKTKKEDYLDDSKSTQQKAVNTKAEKKMVCIPAEVYDDLKAKLFEAHSLIEHITQPM
jgi:hypothetical protein